jgi:hypothetical protein
MRRVAKSGHSFLLSREILWPLISFVKRDEWPKETSYRKYTLKYKTHTGWQALIISEDFISYLGDMQYESHLNPPDQSDMVPRQMCGDPSPLHDPSHLSSNQDANTRRQCFKNNLTSSELVVLNWRKQDIALYKNFFYTHIQKMSEGNAAAPNFETIIDYELSNQG